MPFDDSPFAAAGAMLDAMPRKLLIVEDERKTASFLAHALEEDGWEIEVSHTGKGMVDRLLSGDFEAALLDINLPGEDGLSITRKLRAAGSPLPVLMLSARGAVDERVEGLDVGADDYLAKPFAIAEVVARVRALARRVGGTGAEGRALRLAVGDLTLDLVSREVSRAGQKIDLSPREFRLLEVLMRHAGKPCPRSQLLSEAWDFNFDPGTNLVEVYIRRLREKIDGDHDRKLLHTMRGMGYVVRDDAA